MALLAYDIGEIVGRPATIRGFPAIKATSMYWPSDGVPATELNAGGSDSAAGVIAVRAAPSYAAIVVPC